jgi:hypothetical protein
MGHDKTVQMEPSPTKWIGSVVPKLSCLDGLIIRRDV